MAQYFVKISKILLENVSGQMPYQTLPGPESQFICTTIKTQTIFGILCSRAFRASTSKLCYSFKLGLKWQIPTIKSVRAEKWKKWLLWQKPFYGYFHVISPHFVVSPTQPWPHYVPGCKETGPEVIRLIPVGLFPWKSKKRENNISTCHCFSSPNWPTKLWFGNYPAQNKGSPVLDNSEITISWASLGWKNSGTFSLNMWLFSQTGNLSLNHQGDIGKVSKIMMN